MNDNLHVLSINWTIGVLLNSSKQNLSAIQALQNRAERAVTGNFDFESSVSSIISNLEWMNIKQRLTYFQGLLMFKCLNNMAPSYLSDSLTYLSHHQSYTTRNVIKNHLTIPRPHLSIFKQSFKYSGPTLWNSLPLNITEVNSLTLLNIYLDALFYLCNWYSGFFLCEEHMLVLLFLMNFYSVSHI